MIPDFRAKLHEMGIDMQPVVERRAPLYEFRARVRLRRDAISSHDPRLFVCDGVITSVRDEIEVYADGSEAPAYKVMWYHPTTRKIFATRAHRESELVPLDAPTVTVETDKPEAYVQQEMWWNK